MDNPQLRARVAAQRQAYIDNLAQIIFADAGTPQYRIKMNSDEERNRVRIQSLLKLLQSGEALPEADNFVQSMLKLGEQRRRRLLQPPEPAPDDYHNLAFTRLIRFSNGSGTIRSAYEY